MITLTAKINLLSGNNSALSLGSNNLSGNNISGDLELIRGKKQVGSNPFIIGASKLGDGSTFSDGLDYFIGDQLSDDNGKFATPYEIAIKGNGINNIMISFDTLNKRYPQLLTVYKGIEKTITKTETITTTNKKSISVKNSIAPTWEESYITDDFGDETLVYIFSVAFDEVYIDGKLSQSSSEIQTILEEMLSQIEEDNLVGVNTNLFLYAALDKIYRVSGDKLSISLTLPQEYINYAEYYTNIFWDYTKEETIEETITTTETVYEKGDLIGSYYDNDPIFSLSNLGGTNAIFIEVNDWNTPLYPLVITGIYAEVNIDIDRRNLISISRSIFDRGDLKLPSFGIISNTGNIEFNDIDGEILDYSNALLLESGLKCEIFLNNTLAKAQERIGLFETDQWDYDNNNRVVNVSLKDDLEEWQDINVQGFDYDPRKPDDHKPFKWYYVELWKLTSNRYYAEEHITGDGNYDMLAFDELGMDTQSILQNTYTQYPLLESGSLWQQWTKLCEVCQLHIYKNNDGVIVCRYNGGN